MDQANRCGVVFARFEIVGFEYALRERADLTLKPDLARFPPLPFSLKLIDAFQETFNGDGGSERASAGQSTTHPAVSTARASAYSNVLGLSLSKSERIM